MSTLFRFDIQNVTLYCRVFDELLNTRDKKLAEHLQHLNLRSEAFVVEWFYTFFCRRFKFDNLLKLWDLVLIYSYRVFFRLPIIILTRLRAKILETEDYAVCLKIIHDFNEHIDELDLIRSIT